jgi:hypothetical protein
VAAAEAQQPAVKLVLAQRGPRVERQRLDQLGRDDGRNRDGRARAAAVVQLQEGRQSVMAAEMSASGFDVSVVAGALGAGCGVGLQLGAGCGVATGFGAALRALVRLGALRAAAVFLGAVFLGAARRLAAVRFGFADLAALRVVARRVAALRRLAELRALRALLVGFLAALAFAAFDFTRGFVFFAPAVFRRFVALAMGSSRQLRSVSASKRIPRPEQSEFRRAALGAPARA